MWYITEVPGFFIFNVVATTVVLAALSFAIPPFINWLEKKINREQE